MAEQTVVDFLVADGHIHFEIIWLAKQMEKEQIKQAWQWGVKHEICAKNAEQYYIDTFGK